MNDQTLTHYLLGELPAAEQEKIEAQLFTDDKLFQQVRALKAELTDDYVRGNLSATARLHYEQRFLATTGREDVRFAKALTQVLNETEPAAERASVAETKPSLWESLSAFFRLPMLGVGLAAATVLLLIGGIWMYQQTHRLQSEVQQANAVREAEARKQKELEDEIARAKARQQELDKQLQQAQQQSEQTRKDLEKLPSPAPTQPTSSTANTLLSVLLVPSLVRGQNARERITIPADTGRLQFQLDLDPNDKYTSYRAEFRTKRGELIQRQNKLVPRLTAAGRAVYFVAPAAAIRNGDYDVKLFGVTETGDVVEADTYLFTAVRR